MRQIRIDYRPPAQPPERQRRPRQSQGKALRCSQHPGVRMVLAGSNARRNTIRYLCPMCNAMGLPPIEVATGVISGYFADRGYGFIQNGGPRIFFHVSDWQSQSTPYVGMPVTCVVEENAKGLIGKQVRPR